MKRFIVVFAVAVALMAPCAVFAKDVKQKDPYANKWVLGFSAGGYSSGQGSTGMMLNVGVEYYIMKYVSTSLTTGYGFFGQQIESYTYDNQGRIIAINKDNINTNVVPVDLAVIGHILPGKSVNPYIGPGGGFNYLWWSYQGKDESDIQYHVFATAGVTIKVSKKFAMNIGLTFTVPWDDKTSQFAFDQYYLSYGLSGGYMF